MDASKDISKHAILTNITMMKLIFKPRDKNKCDMTQYFLDTPDEHNDMQEMPVLANHMKKKCADIFQGTGCFKSTVHTDIREDAKQYQAPPRLLPVVLQKLFKETLDKMVKEGILQPLRVDVGSEWYNSFLAVPKPNHEVRICMHPVKLNQAIIYPMHKGQMVAHILSHLTGAKYFSLLDAKSGFWNLSSKLTTFVCTYD